MLTARQRQHGFTLLELSIALAVIGIVVAGGLTMSTSMVDRTAYVQTGSQMDEIDKAVAAYVSINRKMPCPADRTKTTDATGFGQADCAAGLTSNGVTIGMLPVRTLGLRDRYAADEYGNRYTYAVTTSHTTDAGFRDDAGRVVIRDSNDDDIISDASYLVVSHGGDGKGAYRYETASNTTTCSVGGMDAENCNNDNVFRDTRFNRGTVSGNWFDDTVRFKQKQLVNVGSETTLESYWDASGNDIYNTNIDKVGIGTAAPLTKLEVESTVANGTVADLLTLDSNNTGNGAGAQINFRNASDGIYASLFADRDGLGNRYVGMRARTGAGVNDTPLDYTHNIFSVSSAGQARTKSIELRDNTRRTGQYANILLQNAPQSAQALRGINIDINNTSSNTISPNSYSIGVDMNLQSWLSRGIRMYVRATESIGLDLLSTNYNTDVTFFKGASINGTRITGVDISVDGANSTAGKFVVNSTGTTTATGLTAYHNNYGVLTGCTIGTNTHAMYCTGNIQASGTITPSDARLKRDIEPLLDVEGLQAIKALRPVHYHWKDPSRTKRDIGFIAQELEKVLPDAVDDLATKPGEDVTYKGVQYEKLIAPMVLAIQQLADKVDGLWNDLKSLITRVDAQEKDIRTLTVHNAALQQENALLKEENVEIKKRLDAIEAKLKH